MDMEENKKSKLEETKNLIELSKIYVDIKVIQPNKPNSISSETLLPFV